MKIFKEDNNLEDSDGSHDFCSSSEEDKKETEELPAKRNWKSNISNALGHDLVKELASYKKKDQSVVQQKLDSMI